MRAWVVLALLIGAGLLLFLRGGSELLSGLSTGEIVTMAAGLLLATIYIISLFNDERTRPMQAIRYIVAWLAIGFALIAGYSYREELSVVGERVVGELRALGRDRVIGGQRGRRARRSRPPPHGRALRRARRGQWAVDDAHGRYRRLIGRAQAGGRGTGRRRPRRSSPIPSPSTPRTA